MLHGGSQTWAVCTALGELRSLFGIQLGLLAATYKLGLEGDLATILPPEPDDGPDADTVQRPRKR
jgi:hypothetical protein